MSSGTDVLLALRQAIKQKNPVTYTNDSGPVSSFSSATHIVLSSTITLPKSAPTRLRKPGTTSTDPQSNPQDFFALGAVYLAWLLRDASSAEYMKQVRENGYTVGFVSVTERKAVADWLEDKTQTLSGLVPIEGKHHPFATVCTICTTPNSRMSVIQICSSSPNCCGSGRDQRLSNNACLQSLESYVVPVLLSCLMLQLLRSIVF